ncbi:MAG: dephospho-CoA kinase [Fusobacteria bacterium]|nr:MAG: dephospho-CoA kinase [Fusobacteriota bacterium]KAF0227887.1 MAG: dephospho-CoA [Fusobacteriota bacterium]
MRIAITGGIGSGKSYVANYIKAKGYKVIDTDIIAKELMEKGNSNYINIIDSFGNDILKFDGEIDRPKLRNIVFQDDIKRQLLNSITHPNIMKKAMEVSDGTDTYFIEVPLLFEENLESYFDQAWVMDCSDKTQIKRVCERSNLSQEEVLDIIRCQMPREERISKADIVINSEREDINEYIDELLISLEKAGHE